MITFFIIIVVLALYLLREEYRIYNNIDIFNRDVTFKRVIIAATGFISIIFLAIMCIIYLP